MQVDVKQQFANIDIVAIDILNVFNPIRVIAIYRAPSTDTDPAAVADMKLLVKCLKQLCDVNRSIIITGDLNLPGIDWSNPNLVADRDCCSVLFAVFANQFSFAQLVETITRPNSSARNLANGDYTGSLIDLVLCNDTHIVHDVEVTEPFCSSDHCNINFCLSFLPLKANFNNCFPVDVNYRNFNKCNWDDVKNYLYNIDWYAAYSDSVTVEQHAEVFL